MILLYKNRCFEHKITPISLHATSCFVMMLQLPYLYSIRYTISLLNSFVMIHSFKFMFVILKHFLYKSKSMI